MKEIEINRCYRKSNELYYVELLNGEEMHIAVFTNGAFFWWRADLAKNLKEVYNFSDEAIDKIIATISWQNDSDCMLAEDYLMEHPDAVIDVDGFLQNAQIMTVDNVTSLIGKKVKFFSKQYQANPNIVGVAKITAVDLSQRFPITSEVISGEENGLKYAFKSHYCDDLCLGDSDRPILYKVID